MKLVQVTGAGLDRLDLALLKSMGIAVANVPGGSNSAIAEYAVTHVFNSCCGDSRGPTQKFAPAIIRLFARAW